MKSLYSQQTVKFNAVRMQLIHVRLGVRFFFFFFFFYLVSVKVCQRVIAKALALRPTGGQNTQWRCVTSLQLRALRLPACHLLKFLFVVVNNLAYQPYVFISVSSGQKDHYFVDLTDDVVRGSIVTHEVCIITLL
jgi:hypothetical protein